MVRFIDDHRGEYGVEPICRVLPIAPSTYYQQKLWASKPEFRSRRAIEDERICVEIRRVWTENKEVYGAHKVWKELERQGIVTARCRVERLMKAMGLEWVVRGRAGFTTIPGDEGDRPLDLVDRNFTVAGHRQARISSGCPI